MPIRTLFRTNWAFLMSPLMVVVLLLPGFAVDPSSSGYSAERAATLTRALVVFAPLSALAAASEGARLRGGHVLGFPSSRRSFSVVLPHLGFSVLPAIVLFLVAFIVRAPSQLQFLILSLLVVLCWACFGLALGRWLRAPIAFPLSLVVPALWTILPPSLDPLWLRHLTGTWEGCCALDQVPSTRVYFSALCVSLGVGGASLLLAAARRLRLRLGSLSVACVVVGLGMGAWLAIPVGPYPVQPRPDSTRCVAGQPSVCLWPEHENLRDSVTSRAESVFISWRDAGVQLPGELTEYTGALTDDQASLVGSFATDTDTTFSLVSALTAGPWCVTSGSAAVAATDTSGVQAWLALEAGIGRDEVATRLGDAALAEARRLDALPAQQRISEVNETARAGRECRS